MAVREEAGSDELQRWLKRGRRKARGGQRVARRSGLRFAFYGRTSTLRFQDRQASRGWQREVAEAVIADRGVIVADLGGCGVSVWLPEAGGPVDLGDPMRRALMTVLGAQSQREVLRSRHRVLAAMRAQTCEQGRYLGGRPPYGYRLVDAGPHPNRAHAAWGRRLQRLDPDPVTAPHVRWIFAERLAGRSMAGIARRLNEQGVACPSGADRERNPHRSGQARTAQTVAAILNNPRYTGRQVWQRHPGARCARVSGSGSAPVEEPGQEWAVVSAEDAEGPIRSDLNESPGSGLHPLMG